MTTPSHNYISERCINTSEGIKILNDFEYLNHLLENIDEIVKSHNQQAIKALRWDFQELKGSNGEAVRLLQTQCYVSIGSQDLSKIIDIHKDMIFMMNRSEQWFRTPPNRSSFKEHIKALEVWMITLTEEL